MPKEVTDRFSNVNDQIANAVRTIGRSEQRKNMFKAVYTGKRLIKTSEEIADTMNIDRKRVLELGYSLSDLMIIVKEKGKRTSYKKIRFFSKHRNKILSFIENPQKLKKFPTKISAKTVQNYTTVKYHKTMYKLKRITIDGIDSFSKVTEVSSEKIKPWLEKEMKELLKKILNEKGEFKDWSGETNDMFTSRIRYNGRRHWVAFALKGRSTPPPLTPKKMGTNGDQIQRLFQAPADMFLIQFHGPIKESVIKQMEICAIAKSVSTGSVIYFGVIDGDDSSRIIKAYRTSTP